MKKNITFLILAVSTIFFILGFDPYQEFGPQLLDNPSFSDEFTPWKHSKIGENVSLESPGVARLQNVHPEKSASLTQVIADPARFHLLRLSGDLKTENIIPGKRGWERARLILSSHDKDGKWLPAPHHVVRLTGSRNWKTYAEVFKIIPQAEQLQVTAQLPRATGTMWVKNLSLHEVAEKPSALYFSIFFLFLWSVLLAWALIPYVRYSKTFFLRILVIASAAGILLGTLTPQEQMNHLETDSIQAVKQLMEPAANTTLQAQEGQKIVEVTDRPFADVLHLASKVGHFTFFTLLILCFWAALPEKNLIKLIPDLLMLAAGTEMMQYFVRGRTPLVLDFVIDTGGIILGVLIILVWKRITRAEDSGLGTQEM